MARRDLSRSLELAVCILCTIALMAIAFGHRTPVLAAQAYTPAEIALYTLPDGTLPDLCLTGHDDSGKDHGQAPRCEACRIAGDILVPEPADIIGARIAFAASFDLPVAIEGAYRKLFPPNASPRGPPAIA
ncbi:hypothetical protein Q9315_20740 (plasmid) [Shinella oryzae]|uniref:DUF2946 domain-containing protein n=1 Tax=Shinella oryzae TaxID=2871820 RepID=A0ABY9KCQ2_9HYPH|nr:hypothetical protein [Shinella oryzae]WLS06275.1 hypothetical protein Q9315_20740 [Shinella oryzae]